jgi:hypothetical protein
MSKKPIAILVSDDGSEVQWGMDYPHKVGHIIEVVFLRTPTQDELYTLIPVTPDVIRWKFIDWDTWTQGNITALMGAYE